MFHSGQTQPSKTKSARCSRTRNRTVDDRIIELLYRNLQEVFGEGDAARRRAAIEDFYTEDCVLYVPPGVFVGHDALDKFAGDLRATHPHFVYTPHGMSSLFAMARSLRSTSFSIPNLHSGRGTLAGLPSRPKGVPNFRRRALLSFATDAACLACRFMSASLQERPKYELPRNDEMCHLKTSCDAARNSHSVPRNKRGAEKVNLFPFAHRHFCISSENRELLNPRSWQRTKLGLDCHAEREQPLIAAQWTVELKSDRQCRLG